MELHRPLQPNMSVAFHASFFWFVRREMFPSVGSNTAAHRIGLILGPYKEAISGPTSYVRTQYAHLLARQCYAVTGSLIPLTGHAQRVQP